MLKKKRKIWNKRDNNNKLWIGMMMSNKSIKKINKLIKNKMFLRMIRRIKIKIKTKIKNSSPNNKNRNKRNIKEKQSNKINQILKRKIMIRIMKILIDFYLFSNIFKNKNIVF
jgi:hypothetical protein